MRLQLGYVQSAYVYRRIFFEMRSWSFSLFCLYYENIFWRLISREIDLFQLCDTKYYIVNIYQYTSTQYHTLELRLSQIAEMWDLRCEICKGVWRRVRNALEKAKIGLAGTNSCQFTELLYANLRRKSFTFHSDNPNPHTNSKSVASCELQSSWNLERSMTLLLQLELADLITYFGSTSILTLLALKV